MPIHPSPRRVLCVAEKPSIAKELTRILSEGQSDTSNVPGVVFVKNYTFQYKLPPQSQPVQFTFTSVLGHVNSNDFHDDYRRWSSCEPFELFEAPIVEFVPPKMKPVVSNLKKLARDHDLLLIWTDCDREGEHIGSEILGHCRAGNRQIKVLRSRFSAIIPAQIHNAARNPVALDMLSAAAVEARIELDLRTGAAFTRMQTLALQSACGELKDHVISYGACQFPTMGFVVARYLQIQAFRPEAFSFIDVTLQRDHQTVQFAWNRGHLFDFMSAALLYECCVENPEATVVKVENKPAKKWKPYPLTTVELQKAGSRLLHMSPKQVLEHAEKLYQKGFLSYPRTETDQFDPAFDFSALIRKQTQDPTWGTFAQRLEDGEFSTPRNGKKNDKAHPPIHPTAWTNVPVGDEKRVYDFVVRRFLAACSKDAEGRTTTVGIEISSEGFHASGLVVLAKNYLDVYPYDKWATHEIPDFQLGETFVPTICELKEGHTTAPSLLTEADLVTLMDQNGVGTDATIAEHISKVVDREYVMEQKQGQTKYLVPSNLGIALVEGWDRIGIDRSVCKPHLRRETEHRMQLICDGIANKNDVLYESLNQYKEVFITAKREMRVLTEVVIRYLRDDGSGQTGNDGTRGTSNDLGNGSNRSDDDDDDNHDRPGPGSAPLRGRRGRGTEARGTRGARGSASFPSARTTRGGRGTSSATRGRGTGNVSARSRTAREDKEGSGEEDGTTSVRPGGASGSRVSGLSTRTSESSTTRCGCMKPAVERTVLRDTANKGKRFWACSAPQGEGCGFFEWIDDVSGEPQRQSGPIAPSNHRPVQQQRTNSNRGDILRCQCNLTAVQRTVNKEGPNKGRVFWVCPNSEAARCKFFEWDDERINGGGANGGGGSIRSGPNRSSDRGGGPTNGGGTTGECFKCNQPGHWAISVTTPTKMDPEAGQEVVLEQEQELAGAQEDRARQMNATNVIMIAEQNVSGYSPNGLKLDTGRVNALIKILECCAG
ncbi:prokaryotic type i dna topoisomerase [Phaffia rhodozyma]|uniref:DNA topoisomerase n=1 Tax=Phaffia rhodozyma TaxID=264483 RepID=A0A0F7SYR4_PHARH|nr:prokaryotic type i dna topoisomerase [Phaffia rhodozyma]